MSEASYFEIDEPTDFLIIEKILEARQDAYNAARDVPILGEAMTAKQHFDFFDRFRKKDK